MSFFFRKQAHLEAGFESFLGCIERCLEVFLPGMLSYLEHGLGESFEKSVSLAHAAESEADDIRTDLERTLYKEELLPDSRGDLLGLLEACDRVANKTEDVLFSISIRRIEPPGELREDFQALLGKVEASVRTLLKGMRVFFVHPSEVRPFVEEVDRHESECDHIQHEILRKVYALDWHLSRKMQIDDLVKEIGAISDAAEGASRRLDITAIKRNL